MSAKVNAASKANAKSARAAAPSGKKKPATLGGGPRSDEPLRLHGSIAQILGVRIVTGWLRPGHVLDGEIESSGQLNVSRGAYREAIRILAAKGLIRSRPKIGSRVSPQHEWHLLDPDVLAWIFHGDPDPSILHSLFELRTMVEPPAAALAAERRLQHHLDAMRIALEDMRTHTLTTQAGRIADQNFHAALLSASGNPFVISLTNGVTAAVDALTEFKQRDAPLTRDPVTDHERVYDAIAEKDAEKARKSMAELIRLAILDTPIRRRLRGKR
jgi:DNA-binding FadR family transcriptional regulator